MSGKNPIPTRDGQIYEGVNVLVPVGGFQVVKSSRDPTTNDKKYPITTIWVNTVAGTSWQLVSITSGTPNWVALSVGNFVNVTGTTQQLTQDGSFIANNASQVAFTLPTTATVGSTITIIGNGAGGWTIAQNAGQTINMNSQATTTGTGGSLSSTNRFNSVTITCTVANTTWVVNDFSGTFTFV